ncbi:hypothetical protein M0811_11435 [Anaeramoeba ignava]|uniref:Uncharacterized protein n=1 Tax=Anaeramoeba ignava TaxID=1746090 RepID=A0A9Q0LEA0_ANAIG|nr:hypothetical protein M0811_11435 [Anaeramoeba ignava]
MRKISQTPQKKITSQDQQHILISPQKNTQSRIFQTPRKKSERISNKKPILQHKNILDIDDIEFSTPKNSQNNSNVEEIITDFEILNQPQNLIEIDPINSFNFPINLRKQEVNYLNDKNENQSNFYHLPTQFKQRSSSKKKEEKIQKYNLENNNFSPKNSGKYLEYWKSLNSYEDTDDCFIYLLRFAPPIFNLTPTLCIYYSNENLNQIQIQNQNQIENLNQNQIQNQIQNQNLNLNIIDALIPNDIISNFKIGDICNVPNSCFRTFNLHFGKKQRYFLFGTQNITKISSQTLSNINEFQTKFSKIESYFAKINENKESFERNIIPEFLQTYKHYHPNDISQIEFPDNSQIEQFKSLSQAFKQTQNQEFSLKKTMDENDINNNQTEEESRLNAIRYMSLSNNSLTFLLMRFFRNIQPNLHACFIQDLTGGFGLIFLDPQKISLSINENDEGKTFRCSNLQLFKPKLSSNSLNSIVNLVPCGGVITTLKFGFLSQLDFSQKNFNWKTSFEKIPFYLLDEIGKKFKNLFYSKRINVVVKVKQFLQAKQQNSSFFGIEVTDFSLFQKNYTGQKIPNLQISIMDFDKYNYFCSLFQINSLVSIRNLLFFQNSNSNFILISDALTSFEEVQIYSTDDLTIQNSFLDLEIKNNLPKRNISNTLFVLLSNI